MVGGLIAWIKCEYAVDWLCIGTLKPILEALVCDWQKGFQLKSVLCLSGTQRVVEFLI